MDRLPQLITLDDAAALAAGYGLTDLNRKFWARLVDDSRLAAQVVKRRRRVLREHVEAFIQSKINLLRACPPRL